MSNIAWLDITVPDAAPVRDFYAGVLGWEPEAVDMGGYADFNMVDPATGTPTAGVCHARGPNEGIPPVWIVYFVVEDLDASLAECAAKGGEVVKGPMPAGSSRIAFIKDPAGAPCAIVEPGPDAEEEDGAPEAEVIGEDGTEA